MAQQQLRLLPRLSVETLGCSNEARFHPDVGAVTLFVLQFPDREIGTFWVVYRASFPQTCGRAKTISVTSLIKLVKAAYLLSLGGLAGSVSVVFFYLCTPTDALVAHPIMTKQHSIIVGIVLCPYATGLIKKPLLHRTRTLIAPS